METLGIYTHIYIYMVPVGERPPRATMTMARGGARPLPYIYIYICIHKINIRWAQGCLFRFSCKVDPNRALRPAPILVEVSTVNLANAGPSLVSHDIAAGWPWLNPPFPFRGCPALEPTCQGIPGPSHVAVIKWVVVQNYGVYSSLFG